MKVQAIIPTAGIGQRMNMRTPKPFVEICGKPLFVHTLGAFEKSSVIDSIVLVGHPDNLLELNEMIKQFELKKIARVVAGGQTRRESVANGLKVCDEDTQAILVHDGARPLVSIKTIEDAIAMLNDWQAVVAAVPVKSTVKKAGHDDLVVKETLDRSELWEIQTPQAFRRDVLLAAHAQWTDGVPTDDAMMAEQAGVKVKILVGDYKNIKVTTQEDLIIAEAFCRTGNDRS